jgi:hypothetical protein
MPSSIYNKYKSYYKKQPARQTKKLTMVNKRFKSLLHKEMTRKEFIGFTAVIFSSLFGFVGVITELLSHASTPYSSVEAENGTLSGATIVNDVNASGGMAVQFGNDSASPYSLRWAPPELDNPVTVNLNTTTSVNTAATGYSGTDLDNTKDYIIVLPSSLRTTTVTINGGRNIIIKGGHATLAGTQTDAVILITDQSTNGAPTPQQGRIVHIEGILVDASGGLSHDGIDYNCPSAIVQIQNCRITGMQGQKSEVHADISQNQGGAQEVRYDHVTGSTNYQGFFLPPGGGVITNGVKIGNVDLSYWEANLNNPITYLLWSTQTTDGTQNNPVDIIASFVISNNRSGQTVLADSIWAPSNTPLSEDEAGNITFAAGANVTGTIIDGNINPSAIPSGGFCPIVNCGLNYVSPGYQ